MRIVNLSSGSKANSTFIGFNDSKILIDAGLVEKKLCEELFEINESIENIKAVFVTHEHVDHIRAIKTLAKKYDIDFYFHEGVISSGAVSDIKFKEGRLHTFKDNLINTNDVNANRQVKALIKFMREFVSNYDNKNAFELDKIDKLVKIKNYE